jgi:hypothetical protein
MQIPMRTRMWGIRPMMQTVGNLSSPCEAGSSMSKLTALHISVAIKQNAQNPVFTSRYLAWKSKTPRRWLDMCVKDDKRATNSTSGGVLTRRMTMDLVMAMVVPVTGLLPPEEPDLEADLEAAPQVI